MRIKTWPLVNLDRVPWHCLLALLDLGTLIVLGLLLPPRPVGPRVLLLGGPSTGLGHLVTYWHLVVDVDAAIQLQVLRDVLEHLLVAHSAPFLHAGLLPICNGDVNSATARRIARRRGHLLEI